uniref:CCHC-type domain-containing protein n=1 Tax=Tanacetum cinerariifolium TaxID=118510 RepID=A0A699HWD4_TANCI|nr:hypothetical protein [Tanacetum cinerariifolium]
MNYLEEKSDGEAMINSIKIGDQSLPRVTQVSISGTSSIEQPPLKDKSMWSDQEQRIQKIDHLTRHMLGSEYGEQDRKAVVLYESMVIQKIINKNLMDINIDALYNILKKNERDVNDAMGPKKKTVVVTSDPLALIAEKMKVSKSKEKVVVSSDSEGSEADDFSELKKIAALLAKAFNQRKFYYKPTNNNLRTSSTSQSANKKQEFIKNDKKKAEKKDDEKKRDMRRVKCYNCKKEGHFAKDCKKVKAKYYEYYKTKMLLVKKDKDEQVLLAEDQAWMESSSDSDQEINANMVFMAQIEKVLSDSEASSSFVDEKISEKRIERANQQSKDFENQNKDLQDKYDVLKNQAITFEINNKELNEQLKELIEMNNDLLDQTKEEIADQEVLNDKMSVQLVELDKHVRDLKNTVLEKDFKISELEECVRNKDLEIEKCLERLNLCVNKLLKMGQRNQTVHMIIPSKDNLYNGRKGIGFENSSYFEKAKDLRPTLYDEKVIGLGYTSMFHTHSDEALEIEKIKRSRENKIEFAYDYGNLNAIYVNQKINFEDDYFQDITNPNFEKIDCPFQQTTSLKPYVPNVILEKISSENVSSELENQSENDCLVVEKECDQEENPKVIAPEIFKLNVSQCVSLISMSKSSCDSNNVEIKLKRKRHLDTFSSVRRPKNSSVIWKKKGSSNTSNVGEIGSVYMGNDAMNVSCDSRMNDLLDDNNFFIFDDESVKISPVSKMTFRKKPRDSMNVHSKSNSNKSLPRTVHKWLPKLQPLAEPVAKWFSRVKRQIDKFSKTPNSPGPIHKWVTKVC